MTLEYILNEPSVMENDGKLRKVHTLMLTVRAIMMPILKWDSIELIYN